MSTKSTCRKAFELWRDTIAHRGDLAREYGSEFFPSKEDALESARSDLSSETFYAIARGVSYLGPIQVEDAGE